MPLLESDEEFLKSKGYDFEAHDVNGEVQLVIHKFELPSQYTPRIVDLLIRFLNNYPKTKLDMFWTIPTVNLTSGQPPAASSVMENYLGKTWQRWSRHWQIAWMEDVDGLNTFMAAIKTELARGI